MEVANFHHVQFTVSNALQASFWYCCNFGFERFAERRSSDWRYNEVAVRNGKIILVFKCALLPNVPEVFDDLMIHGDFVKNVAYSVDNVQAFLERASETGCCVLEPLSTLSDEHGSVRIATIAGPIGSLVHSLIENVDYRGIFLPGFKKVENFAISATLDPVSIQCLDHVVENYDEDVAETVAQWYNRNLNLNRFWSIDDKQVCTKHSSLKAQIMSNGDNSVQITLVEPVPTNTNGRGQIREFLDFHGGPGIQHIAFKVDDIIAVVGTLRERGVEFLDIPDAYYDQLAQRLAVVNLNVTESLADIKKMRLLVDFDENGYLLQTFTKPMQDRPTLFIEVIQRHNFNGFGAGNFKALFDAVEEEQKRRGTLYV